MDAQIYPTVTPKERQVLRRLVFHDESHGLGIVRQRHSRIARGSVYYLLERLEDKGLVTSRRDVGRGGPGRTRRLFSATPLGAHVLVLSDQMELSPRTCSPAQAWRDVQAARANLDAVILSALSAEASTIVIAVDRAGGRVHVERGGAPLYDRALAPDAARHLIARCRLIARLEPGRDAWGRSGMASVRVRERRIELRTDVVSVPGGERCTLRISGARGTP